MGHYAKVNNGIVEQVIVAEESFFEEFVDTSPGLWIKTSYNTRGGVHYDPITNQPSEDQSKALRKNFAGVGMAYDHAKDAFIPIKPFPTWVLDEFSCTWNPPIPYPQDKGLYSWDEEKQQWISITQEQV